MEDLSRLESMRDRRGGTPGKKIPDLSEIVTMRDVPDGVLAKIDQYELTRELGGGGFGTVYLARDTVSGVEYAVKGLPPLVKNSLEELENIRANFALVSRLHHPNIAAALHLHPARDVWYGDESVREKLRVMPGETLMVMEYAPGVTLSKWRKLFPGNKVPLEQALEIARQIASALDYAHGQRIIHRDVKPSNVVVETKKGGGLAARVLDFGLAAEIRSSMGRVSREVRDTAGTRPYMAPEQWRAEKQGPASDQYALAVLVHELLAGEVPFASAFETGDFELMKSAATAIPFAAPEGLPGNVRAALEKALAKKPSDRFGSCGAFAAALEGKGAASRPPSGTGGGSPAASRQTAAEEDAARACVEAKLRKRRLERIPDGDGFAARKEALSEVFDRAEFSFESRLWTDAAREFTEYAERLEELERLDGERKTAKTKREGAQRAQAKASEAHAETYAEAEWTAGIKRFADGDSAFVRMDFAAAVAAFDESAAAFSRSVQSAEEERKRREREAAARAEEERRHREREAARAAEEERKRRETVERITLPGGAEMRFRWCPAGTFTMGSPESEEGRYDNERQHRVTLTKGFWLAETPVTQGQWESVMGNNPSYFKGADRPVERVSWDDCQAFVEKVNAQLPGVRLRLPTEAEWEYACRAGTTGAYGGTGKLGEMGWYDENNYRPREKVVRKWFGLKKEKVME